MQIMCGNVRGTEYNASLKNLHVLIALLLLHSQKTQLEQQTDNKIKNWNC